MNEVVCSELGCITELPSDIMTQVILPMLDSRDLCRFTGMTCRRIREAYYTPAVFFTRERPFYATIGPTMEHIWMPDFIYYLFQHRAPLPSAPIPIHFVLAPRPTLQRGGTCHDAHRTFRCHSPYELSDAFKYTIQGLSLVGADLPSLATVFAEHPEFQSLSVIHMVNTRDRWLHIPHTTHPFHNITSLRLDMLPITLNTSAVRSWFPDATVHIGTLCVPEDLDFSTDWLRKATIDTALLARGTVGDVKDELQPLLRQIRAFIASPGAALNLAPLLVPELERRLVEGIPYRFELNPCGDTSDEMIQIARIYGKYATSLAIHPGFTRVLVRNAWQYYVRVRTMIIVDDIAGTEFTIYFVARDKASTVRCTREPCIGIGDDFRTRLEIASDAPLRPAAMRYATLGYFGLYAAWEDIERTCLGAEDLLAAVTQRVNELKRRLPEEDVDIPFRLAFYIVDLLGQTRIRGCV